MIRFTIPGRPVGKERPRTVNGHTYTPQRTKDYETLVRAPALEAGVRPLVGPLRVKLVWAKQVPKSWSKKRKAEALAGVYAMGTPDLDNVGKSCLDSLNTYAYADDAQVVSLSISRVYVEQESSVTVEIETLARVTDAP